MMSTAGLVILPFAVVVGSWVPLLWFVHALGNALGIPGDAPVRDRPFGLLWLLLFLFAMNAFMLAGLWLGLYSVVAILRLVLGWTWAEVSESMFAPGLLQPTMWGLTGTRLDSEAMDRRDDPMYDPLLDEGSP